MYKQYLDMNGQISTGIIRVADNAYIPANHDNIDYQSYLKWVAEGGVPTPADEVKA